VLQVRGRFLGANLGPSFVSGYRFSDTARPWKSNAPLGAGPESRVFSVEHGWPLALLFTSLRRNKHLRTITLAFLAVCLITSVSAQKPKHNADSNKPNPQLTSAAQSADAQKDKDDKDDDEDKGPWKGMQYRLVGPFRGGRVVAVSGVVGQENVFYFGAVAGGVWKTTDAGLNWRPIFDKQKDASPAIGAIAVSESDPNVIYVGTGEACIRVNIVGGNGVYKFL
jgi:hypothetical protein